MRRRTPREQSVLANPILIGALTVLTAIAAVTLAYQANNGLPFVPKYHLNLQIRNASELTHGAEVHMGGALVGNVTTITGARDAKGQPIALLKLSLNKTVQPLPVDSTFNVRLKGAIGLKYLEVTPGTSARTFANGATVPVSQASSEVDLDQVLSMFDPKTAEGIRETTIGFSDALAGRGNDVNNAIGAFVPLLRNLLPVATNLASPRTDLAGLFRGLESFSGAVAPVAQTQADLYANLDTTFRALAPVAVPFLQTWISETPPTFQTVISDSPQPAGVPAEHSRSVLGASSRLRNAQPERSGPRRRVRGRHEEPAADAGARRRLVTLAKRCRPTARRRRSTGTRPHHRDRQEPALPAGVRHARSDDVQLRVAVPTEHGKRVQEHLGNGTALRFQVVIVDDIPGSEAVPSSSPFPAVLAQPSEQRGQRPAAHESVSDYGRAGREHECAAGTSRTRRDT